MRSSVKSVTYFLLGQAGWFACVLSAARGVPWVGAVPVGLAVVAHAATAPRPGTEVRFILAVTALGGLWDSLLVRSNLLAYPSGMLAAGTAPYWILALWALFAAQFNTTYVWLKRRIAVAALLGAIAGPLTFHGGASLGALRFMQPWPATIALFLGWGCLLPLITLLSRHWDGTHG